MILIVGVGRCGTSFVTRWLKACGMNVGSSKWFKPMNAGMENQQTLEINARLLKHYVKGEDVNLYHVRGDILDLNYDAVKDTNFLTHTGLIREWAEVRDDLQIIWMHRDPKMIVESVYKMPEWNTPAYRTNVKMIEQKVEEFREALEELDLEWKMFMFPKVLDAPGLLIDFLGDELPDDAGDIWDDLRDDTIRKG